MSNGILHMGQSIYDVRLIIGILDPLPPFVHISRNLSVLFVRKISQLSNPPSPPQCGHHKWMAPKVISFALQRSVVTAAIGKDAHGGGG